jgi:hypothetical protein
LPTDQECLDVGQCDGIERSRKDGRGSKEVAAIGPQGVLTESAAVLSIVEEGIQLASNRADTMGTSHVRDGSHRNTSAVLPYNCGFTPECPNEGMQRSCPYSTMLSI